MFIAIWELSETLRSNWALEYVHMKWHLVFFLFLFFVHWLLTSNKKLKDMRLSWLWCLTIDRKNIAAQFVLLFNIYNRSHQRKRTGLDDETVVSEET